jgi:hypothetical protein
MPFVLASNVKTRRKLMNINRTKKINGVANKFLTFLSMLGLMLTGADPAAAEAVAKGPSFSQTALKKADSEAVPESLQQAILAHSREIKKEGGQYRTLGRGFSVGFNPDGIALQSQSGAWDWGMKVRGYGVVGETRPVSPAKMASQGNKITYSRGPIQEWYVNGSEGLEQGFTLTEPPVASKGEEGSSSLSVAMAVSGNLTAALEKTGGAIVFRDSKGDVALRYGKLYAFDAKGRSLPSRMVVSEGGVELRLDAEKAVYPITIDPLIWVEQQKLTASDAAAFDYFGDSVSVSGDTALVGAFGDDDPVAGVDAGSAYVFTRDAAGVWSEQAKLTASDATAGDLAL